WTPLSAGERVHRVAELKPNDFGLFDVLGNAWEWCQDEGKTFHPNFGGRPILDDEELDAVWGRAYFIVRGGAYNSPALATRCAARISWSPNIQTRSIGFRIARTIH